MLHMRLLIQEYAMIKITEENFAQVHITRRSSQSLRRKAWKRFRRHKLAMFGLIILSLWSFLAVFAPVLDRYPPDAINLLNRNLPPSSFHWLGTDGVGRDVWSRVLHGGRISLIVAFTSVFMSTAIAIFLGALSGYLGGRVDLLIMRFTDVVMSVPPLVLLIALVSIVGPGLKNIILAIGLMRWPGPARIVRGQVLSFREQDFVAAAKSVGDSPLRIVFQHILPSALSPVIVSATLQVASAILLEASMSFLGLGIPPPTPSWGNMLQSARSIGILKSMPWLWLAPGLAIIICVLSVNFIGDGLRDALDPRMSR